MIHRNAKGNYSGTIVEWNEFYKWSERNDMQHAPIIDAIEKYGIVNIIEL